MTTTNKILKKGLIQINLKGIILSLVLFSLHLLPSYCTENLQEEKTQLSFKHTFIIPDNAQINDDCGKFYSLFVHPTVDQIQFEIIGGNEEGIFKIDRSFINNISVSSMNQLVIEFVNKIAELKGFKVICEGTEDSCQIKKLLHLGNHSFQGYYFGRPETFLNVVEKYTKGIYLEKMNEFV